MAPLPSLRHTYMSKPPHVPEGPAKQQFTLTPALPSALPDTLFYFSLATILHDLQKKDVIGSHGLGLGQVRLRLRSLQSAFTTLLPHLHSLSTVLTLTTTYHNPHTLPQCSENSFITQPMPF